MKIRQEESTPIGNFFHDCGVKTIFQALEVTVDDFEVDTEQLDAWCGIIINNIKALQNLIKKSEKEYEKHRHIEEAEQVARRGAE